MEQFFTPNYNGSPFVLFDAAHWSAMLLIAAACASLFYFRRRWNETQRRNFRRGLALFIALSDLSWQAWSLYYGLWDIRVNLPLHLCSVCGWGSVYVLLSDDRRVLEPVYFLGIGGALMTILTPDVGRYGFPHYRAFQIFASHGGMLLAILYMSIVEDFRPTWAAYRRTALIANGYMILVFLVNLALGSNYLYLMKKPEFPTLYDLMLPWPWYMLQVEALGLALMAFFLLPFELAKIGKRRR
ncbi:MAG: TIGR02206 family membrane protein [Anaerolineales bacterium]